jgi:prevent-host-death family protein
MTSTFTVHAAKTNLSKLIARAEKGEEIVIARGKKPVARLVPMDAPAHVLRRRAFGAFKGRLKLPDAFFFDPLPDDELDLWDDGDAAPETMRPRDDSVSKPRSRAPVGSARSRKART